MTVPLATDARRGSGQAAAFFDVDGTLVDANIVHYWIWLATRSLSPARRRLWLALRLPRFLWFLVLDRISRTAFNRAFYRGYRRFSPRRLGRESAELFDGYIRPRLLPGAAERVAEHRARGERVVLVSGSLDVIVAPLAEHVGADDALTVALEVRAGRHTGKLTGPPLGEEEKARAVRAWADREGVDLAESWAYGDSAADTPMLDCVGHPVAVNADARLRRTAARRGWPHVEWLLP